MNRIQILYLLLLAVVTLTTASSCGDDEKNYILNPGGSPDDKTPGLYPPIDKNVALRLEVPRLQDGNIFVTHHVAYQSDSVMNYCLEYDPQAMHSHWVAFRFDPVTRQSNVGRSSEPFIDDPALPDACHIGYNGFGQTYIDLQGQLRQLPSRQFDRGHLCASADRYLSREANEQTFFMSNMSPQMSNFNSPYWSSFEQYVQKRGRDASFADTLYVVKGGTIAPGQILGYVARPNGSSVAIPRYYFMALLRCKNNKYSALAFWMEHKDYGLVEPLSNSEISAHVISIDELEQKTDIDFFPNLPDNIESTVESFVAKSAWLLP